MKLEIIGDRAVLTNDDDKAVINVQGKCCTVLGIRDTLEGVDDAVGVIEKIKRIQSLLADSSGYTHVEPPTFNESDVSAIQKRAEPVAGKRYFADVNIALKYKGDGVFVDPNGYDCFLNVTELETLTPID